MKKGVGSIKRGAGATSQAMMAAPRDAIYVWCNAYTAYPKALARFLGRADLRIETPGFLEYRFDGIRVPMVVDHALIGNMTPRQRAGWDEALRALNAMGIMALA